MIAGACRSTCEDPETWETGVALVERWRQQRSLLVPRVDEADVRYQDLLERFQRSASDGNADLP